MMIIGNVKKRCVKIWGGDYVYDRYKVEQVLLK